MTTTTNRYTLIRSIAVALVVISGLLGVVFVGAQEADSVKGSSVSEGGSSGVVGGSDSGEKEGKKDDGGSGGDPVDVVPTVGDVMPVQGAPLPPAQEDDDATCDSRAHENIVRADGTPFDPWDMNHDIVVANGVASITVKNISDVCDYNVALSSYKTDVYVPGHEQEYINSQQLYDEDVQSGLIYNVGPGQTRTLRVSVPSCNYQIDLYTFVDGASASPIPPDFAHLTSTHTLLDWEQETNAGSCFIVCSLVPPVITTTSSATGVVGTPFSHDITITGDAVTPITTGTLPAGLTFTHVGGTLWRISGTPTQAGTVMFTVSATNECGSDDVVITITIGGGSCTILPPTITSSQTASGIVGSSFSYSVTTTGTVSSLTVANLPAGLTFSGTTISGTPTQAGTFTSIITASNQCAVTSINLTITIGGGGDDDDDDNGDDDDDDNGGGGGGHRRRPNVVLFSDPEILGASISLAQIPYTGLGTSIFQLVLFILGLLAISGCIIYTIMRRIHRTPVSDTVSSLSGTTNTVRVSQPVVDEMVDVTAVAYEEYMHATPVLRSARDSAPSSTNRSCVPENIPIDTHAGAVSGGLMAGAPSAKKGEVPQAVARVSTARVQNEARSSRVLISDDGAELIANSVEGDEAKALERLNQIVEIAKSRYPREDGWLILDKNRVREALFVSTLSMVPLFVEWIIRGEDKKVFTFLRMLKHQEQPVGDFMRKVVSDLDNAYRARMEGSDERANVNQHIAEVTYHLSNKELETIVDELLHGVDERYDSAYTSVRLSLVRVLDLIKERSTRSTGATYAFVEGPAR